MSGTLSVVVLLVLVVLLLLSSDFSVTSPSEAPQVALHLQIRIVFSMLVLFLSLPSACPSEAPPTDAH